MTVFMHFKSLQGFETIAPIDTMETGTTLSSDFYENDIEAGMVHYVRTPNSLSHIAPEEYAKIKSILAGIGVYPQKSVYSTQDL